jgi:hypothetical protein
MSEPSSFDPRFPYEFGVYWEDDVYKWSVWFEDEKKNTRGQEASFPDAWRKVGEAVLSGSRP